MCYATGTIDSPHEPSVVDSRIISRYNLNRSKDQRYRAKCRGEANVQYLRFGRFYVLLATKGRHPFFEREQHFNIQKKPIYFQCYNIGFARNHVRVSLDDETFKVLRAYCLETGLHRTGQNAQALISEEFSRYEPYAPVKAQFQRIISQVNLARKKSGFRPVKTGLFYARPRTVSVFEAT